MGGWFVINFFKVLKCFENPLLILAECNICFLLFRSHTATMNKKGFLQVSFGQGWGFSDTALHKEFFSQLWKSLPADWCWNNFFFFFLNFRTLSVLTNVNANPMASAWPGIFPTSAPAQLQPSFPKHFLPNSVLWFGFAVVLCRFPLPFSF